MELHIVSLISQSFDSSHIKKIDWKVTSYKDTDIAITPKQIRRQPDQTGQRENIFGWTNYLRREDVDQIITINGQYSLFSYTKSIDDMKQELLNAQSKRLARRILSLEQDLKQLEERKQVIDSNII